MPIMIGTDKLKKLPFGTTPAKKVFIGNDLVWSSNPNNVIFIANGSFYVSNDEGVTWTASNPFTTSPKSVTYYDEYASASSTLTSDTSAGNIEYATSDDGLNWNVKTVLTGKYKLSVLCIEKYENYVWIGIAYSDSSGSTGTNYGILRSVDGGKTFPNILSMGAAPSRLSFGNGVLIGIPGGNYRIYYSSDYGSTWTQTAAGSSNIIHGGIYFDGTQFILNSHHYDTGDKSIRVSLDGSSWTTKKLYSDSYDFFNKSGGYYTSGYTAYMAYSTDLTTWTRVLVLANYRVISAVYTGKKFLAGVAKSTTCEVFSSDTIGGTYVKVSTTGKFSELMYSDPLDSFQI